MPPDLLCSCLCDLLRFGLFGCELLTDVFGLCVQVERAYSRIGLVMDLLVWISFFGLTPLGSRECFVYFDSLLCFCPGVFYIIGESEFGVKD